MSNMMQGILTDAPRINALDEVVAKNMAETLHKHYPGHLWAVTVSGKDGVADVRNMALSGNWGFRLKLPAVYSASDWDRRVMRAGGELLERFKVARGTADQDTLNNLPRDFAGRKVAIL